ncbi:TetR/AcrR family transcriptional regulator [Mobilicoccus caccae]|uniref:TetR family transcriptional regulator n=1 Tax=Mobilicoccus caccae TaxID=1859295 RepID=A0ABQ6IL71_9MICO|nr:TetR/AcrR family transcriptional regulator [Mobilicoccus caccae]GMA38100.1 TetR family transcriptional regulator [Mobilicoccus caccae]
MTQPTGRRPRTDAQRNRAHILAVAEQGFTETGVEVSMDAIAKRAGVGAGTLYRHFPNREELIAAVLADRGPDLRAEQADIEAQETDSRAALDRWLTAVSAWMQAFEGLPEPLRTAHREQTSPLAPSCQEVIATTDRFLVAAQRDGHARPGVRGVDLYLGTLAAAWAGGADSADDSVEPGLREMLRRGWATSTGRE